MDITYLGHSSFRIKSKDTSLVTDPFDPKMVGIKFPTGITADIVTISHNHPDHNNVSAIANVRKVVEGPGEYEIGGITILGFASYHDGKKGEERGTNTIYVIEAEGLRLAHLGDLGHTLSDKDIECMGEIDILMVPVGGIKTITPGVAVDIIRSLEPKIVLPMHFKVEGSDSDVFAGLASLDTFLKEVAISQERLDRLSVKKELLGEEQKVVILAKK